MEWIKNNIFSRILIGFLFCAIGLYLIIPGVIVLFQDEPSLRILVSVFVFLGLLLFRGGIGFMSQKKRIVYLDFFLGLVFSGIAIYCFCFGVNSIWNDLKPKTGLGTAFGIYFSLGSFLPAFAAYWFLRKPK
jgi:drug/metabolite transporter (DMT)-like permease